MIEFPAPHFSCSLSSLSGEDAACACCMRAARSVSRRARVYSSVQRWMYDWHVALACQSSNKIAIVVVCSVHVSGFDSDVGEAHGVCVKVTDGQSASSALRFSRPLII